MMVGLAASLMLAMSAAGSAERSDPPPCAACVVASVAPEDEAAVQRTGITTAVQLPLNELATRDARTIDSSLVVVDATGSEPLDDQRRFQLRSFATAFRAVRGGRIGLALSRREARAPAMASLAAYIDFVVLPPSLDPPNSLSGLAVWTDARSTAPAKLIEVLTTPRLPNSDHVLVSLAKADAPLAHAIADLRAVLPAGLTPLDSPVSILCDTACGADLYLHPDTLDAVALVRPHGPVTRVSVGPNAAEVIAFIDGFERRQQSGATITLPSVETPFLLQIRGWRGTTEGAFAAGVHVTGSRQLRVDEVIARHQVARSRRDATVETEISSGNSVLTLQVPGFAGPLTITADTTTYASRTVTEVEQRHIRINGLDLRRPSGDAPQLPIIEPERVGSPPLAITLTDAYRYDLRGRVREHGRDAYIVAFVPVGTDQPLVSGRAWIDAQTFGVIRVDATETGLRGPIVSSRQIDDFVAIDNGGTIVWLLNRSEVFQVYQGPIESTAIHRVVTADHHELNAPDFASRLEAAHRSDAVMLRDTPHGFRFLVPRRPSGDAPGTGRSEHNAGPDTRRLAPSATDHVATGIVGALIDPNISVPLVFAGVSYVDFNLLKTGAQFNAFFGGTYGRVAWSTPPLFGSGWRLAGDGSAVAVSYHDRAFSRGIEKYSENIRQRPAQASVALVGPVMSHLRVRAGYDLAYTAYDRADTTSAAFIVPSTTPVHAARFALEMERGPWTAGAWWSAALRQRWMPWGVSSVASDPSSRDFQRFGATLARSIVWSPRAVGRVDAAWMSGRWLDRFSQFAFGTFDNALRGYPAVSVRYDTGAVVRSVATWNASAHLRIDGFADCGVVRASDEARFHAYPGFGAATEIPAPFGWLAAIEWGYGAKGVNTNGTTGTHVVRISGFKVF